MHNSKRAYPARVKHACTQRTSYFGRRDRKPDYDDGRVDSPHYENKEEENELEGERSLALPQLPVANPFSAPRRGYGNPPSILEAVHHPRRRLVKPIRL